VRESRDIYWGVRWAERPDCNANDQLRQLADTEDETAFVVVTYGERMSYWIERYNARSLPAHPAAAQRPPSN